MDLQLEMTLNKSIIIETIFTYKTKMEIFIENIISISKMIFRKLLTILKSYFLYQGYNFAK